MELFLSLSHANGKVWASVLLAHGCWKGPDPAPNAEHFRCHLLIVTLLRPGAYADFWLLSQLLQREVRSHPKRAGATRVSSFPVEEAGNARAQLGPEPL